MERVLDIVEVGAVTAAGDDIESSAAALRAGLAQLRLIESHELSGEDPEWDPPDVLRGSVVPGLSRGAAGIGRMEELARKALASLVARTKMTRAELSSAPLWLALPSPADVPASWDIESFGPRFTAATGIAPTIVAWICAGHVATALAVQRAFSRLAPNKITRGIILAVDSHFDHERIRLLDARRQLKSQRARDGFIPGEAAVALLLCTADDPIRARLANETSAVVTSVGTGMEPHPRESELAATGKGLEQALATVLAVDPDPRWVLSDMNGESQRAAEWGALLTRVPAIAAVQALEHPAQSIGDIGAASGALLLALAREAFAKGVAPASSALVLTASHDGARAALNIRQV